MTTATTEPDEQDREPATDEAPPEAPADEPDADDLSPRDRKYRAELRRVEAERDRFRDALVPHVRAAVERIAGQKLTAGSSIWLLPQLDVMQLVGDDLTVDAERVTAAAERLLQHAPQLGQVPDFDAGARSSPAEMRASWQQALRGQ